MVRSCQREFSRAGRAVQTKRNDRRVYSDTVGSCRLDIQSGSQRFCPIPLFNRQLLESPVKSFACSFVERRRGSRESCNTSMPERRTRSQGARRNSYFCNEEVRVYGFFSVRRPNISTGLQFANG